MEEMVYKGVAKIKGNDLYYEYYKQSSAHHTLCLIHGFLSSSFCFRRLIPLLTEKYNVVTVDLPPFGKSGCSTRYRYSYNNIAKSVIELAEHLGIRKFTAVGHSMGGQIGLNIAFLEPELVHKIVLLSSSGYLPRLKKSLVLSSYIPFFYLIVKKGLAKSGVMKNLQNVVYDHSLIDEEMYNGYLQPFLKKDIFKALTKMIRHREGDLSEEQLQKIEAPCLLIWGEYDKVVPIQTGKRLHKDLSNSHFIVLKNTGHLVPEERPKEVYQYIEKFLTEKE